MRFWTAAPALAVLLVGLPAVAQAPAGTVDNFSQMHQVLKSCWRAPQGPLARAGMEVTVRLSFRKNGTILGEPRFTYYSPWASSEVRKVYRESVLEGLAGCVPLRFTPGMGGANAGRIFLFRFIDDRNTQKI